MRIFRQIWYFWHLGQSLRVYSLGATSKIDGSLEG
jgi:hypothetical protein